jgi:hypothetical protein
MAVERIQWWVRNDIQYPIINKQYRLQKSAKITVNTSVVNNLNTNLTLMSGNQFTL